MSHENLINTLSCPPSISVLLCVNRSNPWVREAIESILNQIDGDFEFLIAANACSDELWRELNDCTAGDQRVILHRTNIGQLAFNLNFLANLAKGEYLVRMDSDDISEKNRILVLREYLASKPVDVLGSAVTLINYNGKEQGRWEFPLTSAEIKRLLPTRTVFCHPAVAIRKKFLYQLRGYLGGFVSEDTDLWIRAMRISGGSFHNLPEPLLRYRVHPDQSTSDSSGYPEVSAHWWRELLATKNLYALKGFISSFAKYIFDELKKYTGSREV
jgi:glycosyltransferase involved in cell wall biosynthesis